MATASQPGRPQSPTQEENIKSEESSPTPSPASQEEYLSLGLLNINGLRSKTHEIRHIIARDKLHVVALCETKLNSKVKESDIYIPGFRIWRKDRNSYGGGVALYVQDHIETRLRPDLMNFDPTSFTPVMAEADDTEADETKPGKKDPEVEIIWVEMVLPVRPILLGCCYRPTKDKTKYLEHIKKIISQISEKNKDKDIFLMGDFNFDWMSDSEKKGADDLLSKEGWDQIVKVPTRVTIDSVTCIDHIYTNTSNLLKPESIPTGCSDHNLITVKADRKIPQREGKFRSKQFERGKFNDDIKCGKWGEVCELTTDPSNESLQEALNMFTDIFLQVADKHAPIKSQDFYCLLKLDSQLESLVSKRDEMKYDMIINIYHSLKQKIHYQEQIDNYMKGKPQKSENVATESEETFPFHLPETKKHPQETVSGSVVGQKKTNRREGTRLGEVKRCLEYVCDHVVNIIDETEAELWKLAADFISDPIRHILNGYINIGEFPDELKKMKSFPFSTDSYIKIRQESGPERIRIILSYIFDVILYQRFKDPFIGNEENTEEKLEQLENDRLPVEAVLLDFTSSFDNISHDLLITKLEKPNYSVSNLEMIESFLSIQKGSCGLSRGSCLAQLLRIIIINDLKKNVEPAVICNNYMMIYGNKTEIVKKMKAVNKWATQFNILPKETRKLFKPSELSAMFKILESMVRCNGDESNWIRVPGNIVKQNGDWEYDNISKELELHFGPDSLQKSQTRNTKRPRDAAGDASSSKGPQRREI